ncbi:MAG: AI-2E family transporter [Anaerotruncus massiliensis (ex Togo et al. 2019)]
MVVVQQVDGNIIAPKVIGGSVRLPPLWVLFAVTIGGGLFGVAGMILDAVLRSSISCSGAPPAPGRRGETPADNRRFQRGRDALRPGLFLNQK